MKTKKIIFLTLAIFSFSYMATAQRGVRIGYIDMEYILESVPEYREASIQLEGKVQRWKQDLEKSQREVDQMKLNLANERVLLTAELIEEREEDIKIKENEILEYQQNRFGPNGDLMIQRRQLVQPIQDQVFNIVQEIAESKKYDFIFDKSADVVMLFAAKRNDISDEVLRSIERAGRRVQAENKKEKREIEQQEKLDEKQDEMSEREKELQKKKEEREKAMEDKKAEREELMAQRQRERDSIRAAKKQEYEERRQRLLEERQRRRDSIAEVRENRD
ncbi:OmpH family outer membrane protein [Aequorivita viscosa]|uniref:Periplasmic chaperone for outer membrane proteins Skp n=1 Tax=Aequorivita viscosa TaxID=797419 RepID=A0A1M6AAI8_9FLAO|nr:OmpH family outer membrane protein [Aequorivita viscosa]SDW13640.1 periplasmic chaperone for outer membrane proteins Skp [Aequorivita viscosa]SHI33492.1 periplasmic chaperone for outer membrane proteins Skp [Aequorivita viscosa]